MTRTNAHRRPRRRSVLTDEARIMLGLTALVVTYTAAVVLAAREVFRWLYL